MPEVNMPAPEVSSSLEGKCALQHIFLFTLNPLFRWCSIISKAFQGLDISILPPLALQAVGLKSEANGF